MIDSMNTEPFSVERRARIHAALGDPARLAIVDTLGLGDASPGEIGHDLGLPTNLVAHHVKVLSEAGLVVRTRSEGDRRRHPPPAPRTAGHRQRHRWHRHHPPLLTPHRSGTRAGWAAGPLPGIRSDDAPAANHAAGRAS